MNLQPADLTSYLAQTTRVEQALGWLLWGRRKPVIFDVGACEGEDSIRYAKRFPGSQVFSFEPLPANQALARANFTKYRVANAELVPLALSDRRGPAVFHVSAGQPERKFAGDDWNYGNKSSSLLAPAAAAPMHGWITFPEQITVTCDTFDEFCTARHVHRIDFIHMDVQGAEHLVLAGATQMLPSITALWLEVSEGENYRGQKLRCEIQSFLQSHGFIVVFGESRGIEGDQFYVNRRHVRALLVLAWREFSRLTVSLRLMAVAAARAIGLYHCLRDLRRDVAVLRRNAKLRKEWRAAGSPLPPPDCVKHDCLRDYARRFGLRVLVETGTFYGGTVFALRHRFRELHSIELSLELHRQASDQLAHLRQIHLHHGDSATVLPAILGRLTGPALFWLDGHYSAGPTARGTKDTPIVEELTAIFARAPNNHVILIDDARLFTGANDYPMLGQLQQLVASARPSAQFAVEADIIRIHPV